MYFGNLWIGFWKKDERIVNFLLRTVQLSLCERIISVNAAVDVLDFVTYSGSKNVLFYSAIGVFQMERSVLFPPHI